MVIILMAKKISESDIISLHKVDAEKALKILDKMKSNISGCSSTWGEVVKVRKGHINNYIASLEKREKEFEHFK